MADKPSEETPVEPTPTERTPAREPLAHEPATGEPPTKGSADVPPGKEAPAAQEPAVRVLFGRTSPAAEPAEAEPLTEGLAGAPAPPEQPGTPEPAEREPLAQEPVAGGPYAQQPPGVSPAEQPVTEEAPAGEPPAAEPPEEDGPGGGHGRSRWKTALIVVAALVIVGAVIQVFARSGGGGAVNTTGGGRSPTPAATGKPTPTPTVTLKGHGVPAGGGPIIVLNPGLVSPGGKVGIEGSGFDPGAPIQISLLASVSSTKGTAVALDRAGKDGSLSTQFTMPLNASTTTETVLAQESNSNKKATAQLVTPGGVGTMTITGKSAGKPGDHVSVSASGFGPGETVDVFWGRITGIPAAKVTADGSGSISRAPVPVGVAPVGPTTLALIGEKTHTAATAPFQMLGLYPSASSAPYALQAGKTLTYAGSGFSPNERVLVYLNASSGIPALTPQTDANGSFQVDFAVPFGLTGSQSLIAIGEQSRASVTSGFDILPYNPVAQASTYGALPGTTVSFYATGFAANEVVLVYTGRGQGGSGSLVSAFRVDGKGSASAAGSYTVPSNTGPGVSFTLSGQESGGTASVKLAVTAPKQPVNVPPQPPYVLPPSLGGTPTPSSTSKPPTPSGTSQPPTPAGTSQPPTPTPSH